MADFTKDVVDQLKDQNKKLDVVVSNTAKEVESGAKASEDKKELLCLNRWLMELND